MALIIRIHCHVIFCNCYVTFSLQFSIPKMLHPGVDFLPFPPSCTTYRQVLAVLSKTTLRIKSLVEEQEHLCTCGMGDRSSMHVWDGWLHDDILFCEVSEYMCLLFYWSHYNQFVWPQQHKVRRTRRITNGMWSGWTTLQDSALSSPAPIPSEWPSQEQPWSSLIASALVSDVAAPAYTNVVWPHLWPVSVAQKNKPSSTLSPNV